MLEMQSGVVLKATDGLNYLNAVAETMSEWTSARTRSLLQTYNRLMWL